MGLYCDISSSNKNNNNNNNNSSNNKSGGLAVSAAGCLAGWHSEVWAGGPRLLAGDQRDMTQEMLGRVSVKVG